MRGPWGKHGTFREGLVYMMVRATIAAADIAGGRANTSMTTVKEQAYEGMRERVPPRNDPVAAY